MSLLRRSAFLLLLVSLSSAGAAWARTVRLLSIGNSFSANATKHLGKLAESGGHTLVHGSIVVGGASMELHASRAEIHARDPKDKAGLYTQGRGLVEELKREPWDVVTIQQASIKSHDLTTYQPFAGKLRDLVKANAPAARLMVHQTWAYRVDDPRFTKPSGKAGEPVTQAEMYRGLSAAYKAITKELGAGLIPVGDAFYLADTDPKWGYKPGAPFDAKNAKPGELPDQTHSLHVGWAWRKPRGAKDNRLTLGMDGHHANMAGEYLGGCVFYEVLFDESCVDLPYVPAGLHPAFARFLREKAHEAVGKMREEGGQASATPVNTSVQGAALVDAMPGLVAFWDFQTKAGARWPARGPNAPALQEMKGEVELAEGGAFGPRSAHIKRGQWLMVERSMLGRLNVHGRQAQVTVVAWVRRQARESWQAIAGVWDETRCKRQYCLFLNAPRGTRADEMKRYPLANRVHGHVSAVGGPTPGEEFCITYSSGATEVPMDGWHCLAMSYDGKASRVYVDGRLDALEHYNPFPYAEGLFDGGDDGAPFTVGAVHRGGEWGNFFGGWLGGLAVFDRALTDEEMQKLAALTPAAGS